jgi:hypothetical protein
MTCPDMVPTEDDDRPAASREMANTQLAAGPSRGDRGHNQHGCVDQPGHAHSQGHIEDLEAEQPAHLPRVLGDHASLHQGRVQEDNVWHDRGAQDARGQNHGLGVRQPGHEPDGNCAPDGSGEDGLDQITDGNDTHQGSDHGF